MSWLSTGTRFSSPLAATTERWSRTKRAQLGVDEAVAVGVLEDDVAAELLQLPSLRITPSLTATTGAPAAAKMSIPRRVGEEETTSAALP